MQRRINTIVNVVTHSQSGTCRKTLTRVCTEDHVVVCHRDKNT